MRKSQNRKFQEDKVKYDEVFDEMLFMEDENPVSFENAPKPHEYPEDDNHKQVDKYNYYHVNVDKLNIKRIIDPHLKLKVSTSEAINGPEFDISGEQKHKADDFSVPARNSSNLKYHFEKERLIQTKFNPVDALSYMISSEKKQVAAIMARVTNLVTIDLGFLIMCILVIRSQT